MISLSRRAAVGLGLAAPFAAGLPSLVRAQAEPMTAQGGGFYQFRLGEFRCAVISDGALEGPLPVQQALAANATPEEVAAVLAERFLPTDRGTLHFNAFFVDTGRNKVLIDAGCGTSFGPTGGKLPGNLRAAGIDPGEIDTLLISHAHPDHLFGVLDPSGSQLFSKAQVLVGEFEHGFWTGPADLSRVAAPPEMKQMMTEGARRHLAAVKDRLELVPAERELVPGIIALATPGHTPGHLSFILNSGGRQLFLTYDVVHHFGTALPHPEWKVAFDVDADQAVETRKRVLERVAADRLPVLAYHFPYPGLGHVGRARQGYGWEPIVWSWDPEAQLG
jgi:glyoxylase-like metal-dependent hydrolase (beta-lactamase superfamily II)